MAWLLSSVRFRGGPRSDSWADGNRHRDGLDRKRGCGLDRRQSMGLTSVVTAAEMKPTQMLATCADRNSSNNAASNGNKGGAVRSGD